MASSRAILRGAAKHFGGNCQLYSRMLCGVYEGFPFLIDITGRNATYLRVVIAAMGERALNERQQLFADTRFQRFFGANRVELVMPMRGTSKKCIETLLSGMENAVTQLCANGYVGSDEMGVVGSTQIYRVKGHCHILTEQSAQKITAQLQAEQAEFDAIREDIPLGLVGALIGGMLGCLVVLLVARLGYVTSISSALVGAGIVFGYKHQRLGKKLSPLSAVLCSVIAVVFSYGTFRMDLAIDIHNAVNEIDLPSALIYGRQIMAEVEDGLHQYYENLFLMAGT